MLCLRPWPSSYRCSPVSFDLDDYRRAGRALLRGALAASTTCTSRATSPSWRSSRSTTAYARSVRARLGHGACATSPARPTEATRSDGSPTCSISPSTGCVGMETRGEAAELAGAGGVAGGGCGRWPDAVPGGGHRAGERAGRRAARGPGGGAERGAGGAAQPASTARRSSGRTRSAGDFGWPSYAAAYAELRGIDLERLREQTGRFLEATEERYAAGARRPARARCAAPAWGSSAGRTCRGSSARPTSTSCSRRSGSSRRSRRRSPGSASTCGRQPNVHLDTESRPTKSPRAFCSHAAGSRRDLSRDRADRRARRLRRRSSTRAATRSTTRTPMPDLAFEFRQLGDNSVTESFAFLLENLVSDPLWLSRAARGRGPGAGGRARAGVSSS